VFPAGRALTAASSPATAQRQVPTPVVVAQMAGRVGHPECGDATPQRRVVAIAGIEQRDAARQACLMRPAQLPAARFPQVGRMRLAVGVVGRRI